MNTEVTEFNRAGYVLLKNFFPKEDVGILHRDAMEVFFRQFVFKKYTLKSTLLEIGEQEYNSCLYRLFEDDFECFTNCGKQAQHLISLHQMSLSVTVLDLLRKVGLTSPVISTRPVMFFNHPRLAKAKVYHTVEAHQDWRSMQGSLNSVVLWLPLVDIPKQLGALEILPGSHLHGLRTDHIDSGFGMVSLSAEEVGALLSVEVNVGDALLFSSFLVHQSGENVTDRPRWSCHFRYNDLDEQTFIARKFAHPYIYKPIETLISPNFPAISEVQRIFNQ
jgi:phytanoyl-CoA hydroxylase